MAETKEYQVTARKWRPVEFLSVVGQEHVTQTLKNAIRSGRLHHAYLFSGPRGVGKTTTARILAKALNCQNPGPDLEPCNVCDSCRQITEGRSLDVVEIDGASNNSVDDIRKLRENAKYPAVAGNYKLYIIDEVHMLSTSAFNALLKTLEEPPKHLVFIFATTEPHKVPATILSRCQRFDFRRMQITDIVGRLAYIAEQEGMQIDEDALVVIAKKADGSMRDAQSIFDQVTSFCGTSVTYQQANEALNVIDQGFFFRVTDMMREHNTAEAFTIVEEIMRSGYDAQEFLIGLSEHLRNYLTVITTGSARLIEAAKMYRDRYAEEARAMEQGDIIRALHLTLAAQQAIKTSSQPRLRLELALIQLAVMDSTVNLTQLLEKIDRASEGGSAQQNSVVRPGQAAKAPTSVPSAEPSAPKPGYASMIKESMEKGREEKGSQNVKDLANFPTNAPQVPATIGQAVYAKEPDVVTLPLSNGDGGTSYSTQMFNGLVMEGNMVPAAGAVLKGSLTLHDVRQQWPQFIHCFDDKKALTSALESVQLAEMQGNSIQVFVAEEFHLSFLKHNKDLLNEKLTGFFNLPLHADWKLGTAPTMLRKEKQTANGNEDSPHADHPFIQGIVELLGASRL